jgi:hypothetical protein
MFIGKKAANPNAAKLWIDFLLSKRDRRFWPIAPICFRCAPTSRCQPAAALGRQFGKA